MILCAGLQCIHHPPTARKKAAGGDENVEFGFDTSGRGEERSSIRLSI